MNIKTTDYKGCGLLRPYTLGAATYEILKGIPQGGSVEISGVQDVTGRAVSVSSLRASINNIRARHLRDVEVATRAIGGEYPITIYRIA